MNNQVPGRGKAPAKIDSVTLLGHTGALEFTQDAQDLRIKPPAGHSGSTAWSFKVTGLKFQAGGPGRS